VSSNSQSQPVRCKMNMLPCAAMAVSFISDAEPSVAPPSPHPLAAWLWRRDAEAKAAYAAGGLDLLSLSFSLKACHLHKRLS